ncbi:MAG: agmatinase [Nitrosopumilaceae archaeon]|nr:agmatinase [Nitrosopumilaceae archaeon]
MSYVDLYLDRSKYNPHLCYDINTDAILFGVPFDSTHSFRPGTRFAPNAIRELFDNIETVVPDLAVDIDKISISDIGNTKHTVESKVMLSMVNKITSELSKTHKQLFILGGEHLITFGSYTAFPNNVGYVVFDAHYDLRNEYGDTKFNHATYLRRIIEKNNTAENVIHVGARAYSSEELEFKTKYDIVSITDKDIRNDNGPKLLTDMCSTFDQIYLSVDLDVLDPAYAPGVGNPEALGITSRELFNMILILNEKNILCTDIVELCPIFDNGSTTSIAAKLLSYILAMNKN